MSLLSFNILLSTKQYIVCFTIFTSCFLLSYFQNDIQINSDSCFITVFIQDNLKNIRTGKKKIEACWYSLLLKLFICKFDVSN
jgi:hypothetical protein